MPVHELLQDLMMPSPFGWPKQPDTTGFIEAYSEPHRVYHGIDHIRHVLAACAELNETYDLGQSLLLAAWYHDFVYVVGSKMNEEMSAAVALYRTGNKEIAEAVADTATHAKPGSLLSACLIDADLQGLGTDFYESNRLKVKAEYGGIDEELWRSGRRKFLESYLGRKRLFWTAWGAQYEAPARDNMESELDTLRHS